MIFSRALLAFSSLVVGRDQTTLKDHLNSSLQICLVYLYILYTSRLQYNLPIFSWGVLNLHSIWISCKDFSIRESFKEVAHLSTFRLLPRVEPTSLRLSRQRRPLQPFSPG